MVLESPSHDKAVVIAGMESPLGSPSLFALVIAFAIDNPFR